MSQLTTSPRIVDKRGFKRALSFPQRCLDYIRDPLGFLARAAREEGDLVTLPSPGLKILLVNHPAHIEQILRDKHRIFQRDWYTESVRPLFGSGILTSDGERWRRQRVTAQPVFQPAQVQKYTTTMVETAERTIANWRPGETRNIQAEMMSLTLKIATKTLFDYDVGNTGLAERMVRDLETSMAYFSSPFSIWPWWRHVPTPMNRRFHAALGRLDDVFYEMIRQRRAEGPEGRGDLLSRSLLASDENGRKITDVEIRDELMTMLIAGHATTAVALTYTFYLLAQHPEAEKTLWAELDQKLGGRTATSEDVAALPYTESVLKESMRLYPPVWMFGREAVEDTDLCGHPVAKKVQVLISPWIVQRDPRYWPEPERFDPNRWSESYVNELPRCAYFPFGEGPRTCIGKTFGMIETVLLLATIAGRFRLELVPGQKLHLLTSVTLRPRDGIQMIIRERSRQAERPGAPSVAAGVGYTS